MRSILITGANGFVGRHVVDYCLTKQAKITAVHRNSQTKNSGDDTIRWVSCNVDNQAETFDLLEQSRPDWIIHLAGVSHIPVSWKDPKTTFRSNLIGTFNLLEGITHSGLSSKILIVSSSDVYAPVPSNGKALSEESPLNPLSPYAVTKVGTELLIDWFIREKGVNAVTVRPFSHTGPGQKENFVCSSFAKQIALIELGKQEPELHVGNLEIQRDFSDVRDMVRAYWLALERGGEGEVYNICSGNPLKLKTILEHLLQLSKSRIEVHKDPTRFRKSDIPVQFGDPTKFIKATNWSKEFSMEKTLKDMLIYWRNQLVSSGSVLI